MFRGKSLFLSQEDIETIHHTSMALLEKVGVEFPSEEALAIFKANGVRVEGCRVFLDRRKVEEAVQQAPAQFTIQARNPELEVVVGGDNQVFVPGYGAPFIADLEIGKRHGTMEDYDNLVRLADALPNQDMSGHLLVEPSDVPAESANLYMLRSHMVHSDKPFMGSAAGFPGARRSLEMAAILFGFDDQERLKERPVMSALINSLSPLGYSQEMLDALVEYARWRQPVIIAALVMAGFTGPITIAGVLAQQNAEILAGLTLAQLISPGTPVVYGSTSTNMDMNTAGLAIGSPELSIFIVAHAQMARHYRLPCRGGGCLTDSHQPDAQAGFESMMSMLTTVTSGVNFVLHACGILSSYLTFSYEKMVMDDEICGMVRRFKQGFSVEPATLAYDLIAEVGPGGNFISETHTLERCRTEFWRPRLFRRLSFENWQEAGAPEAAYRAKTRWQELLAEREPPRPDPAVEQRLNDYVEAHLTNPV